MVEKAETTVEITVTRMPIRLLKVVHQAGYQLVCGGRLVVSVLDGSKTSHPDLPAYGLDDFPVDLSSWDDGDVNVSVWIVGRSGRLHQVGPARACTLLFTPCGDRQDVLGFLRRGGK